MNRTSFKLIIFCKLGGTFKRKKTNKKGRGGNINNATYKKKKKKLYVALHIYQIQDSDTVTKRRRGKRKRRGRKGREGRESDLEKGSWTTILKFCIDRNGNCRGKRRRRSSTSSQIPLDFVKSLSEKMLTIDNIRKIKEKISKKKLLRSRNIRHPLSPLSPCIGKLDDFLEGGGRDTVRK